MMINPSLSHFDEFKICFGSHCLRRNVADMFEIWSNGFKQIHFNENKEYLVQLIKAADLSEGILHSGQIYAMKRSAASLSAISSIDERLSGLTRVARMKDMASKENIDDIVEKLRKISRVVFDPTSMKCAINAEDQVIGHVNDELKKLIDSANDAYRNSSSETFKIKPAEYERIKVEDMKFPFATHFVAKTLVTVPRLHKHYAKLVIMSKLVSSKYLLREVREKGGAYGAGARQSSTGLLHFYSYRDPNTDKTIKVSLASKMTNLVFFKHFC
jgi:Zn-dependent M16 (insulinase) family peptidase